MGSDKRSGYDVERTLQPHVTVAAMRHGGTHLILPIVRYLTELPIVGAEKLPFVRHKPLGPVIVFYREPRNRFVSKFKWDLRRNGHDITPSLRHDKAIARLIRKKDRRGSQEYLGKYRCQNLYEFFSYWLSVDALVVRYEDLCSAKTGPVEAERIAKHLGRGGEGEAAFHYVFENGNKMFTGQPSRWQQWFGPKSTKAFANTGGPELMKLLGYAY